MLGGSILLLTGSPGGFKDKSAVLPQDGNTKEIILATNPDLEEKDGVVYKNEILKVWRY